MHSILIIEDDKAQCEKLIEIAKKCNSSIKIFNADGKKGGLNIAEKKDIGAFFIDIQLVDGNGIDLAKSIRKIKKYQFTPIIFITGVPTKEMEAFHDIHCYDYILKPYTDEAVLFVMKKILIDYFESDTEQNKYIILEFKGIKQRVNTTDIIMIESKNRKLFIRTQFEEIRYKHMNIGQFLKKLPEQFVQVHQSIIINTNYIVKINMPNNELIMDKIHNSVPIGVSYKKKVGGYINGIL